MVDLHIFQGDIASHDLLRLRRQKCPGFPESAAAVGGRRLKMASSPCTYVKLRRMSSLAKRILSRENLLALLVFLALVAATVLTAESSPQWIYQGF